MSGRQTGAWLAVWRIAAGTKRSEAAAAPGRQTDVQCELPGRLLKATGRPSPPSGGQQVTRAAKLLLVQAGRLWQVA